MIRNAIWILFLLLCFKEQSLGQTMQFKMYSIEDGLSDNIVRNITQDSYGHIWIGTEYGLNTFNGHEFQSFLHNPTDSNSISNNLIFGLDADSKGNIWIGTNFGLNRYDPITKQFKRFLSSAESNTISDNHIRTVFVDQQGDIWVGTEEGLNVLNSQNYEAKRFFDKRVFLDEFGKKNLSYNRINVITQDDSGNLWIGLDGGGVRIYQKNQGTFKDLLIPTKSKNHLLNIVRAIYQSKDGSYWFGTDGGLVHYQLDEEIFEVFEPSNSEGDLGYKYVWSIIEEGDKLWLSSYGGGLFVFDKKTQKFNVHKETANRTTTYEDNLIWTLFKDRDGHIWMGMDGNGGLGFYDMEARKFDHFLGTEGKTDRWNITGLIAINKDSLLLESSKGRFLLVEGKKLVPLTIEGDNGSVGISCQLPNGFVLSNQDNIFFTDPYFNVTSQISKKESTIFTCIAEGEDGIVWIGTLADGLLKIDLQKPKPTSYFTEGNSKIYTDSRSISALFVESDSILWVAGLRSGLFRFNTNTLEKKQFLNDGKSFKDLTIESIAQGRDHVLWLGTAQNGLLQFNTITNSITNQNTILQTDQIKSIVSDEGGKLWITSNRGLKVYNPKTSKMMTFGVEDGLQDLLFNKNSAYISANKLYFGGVNGFNRVSIDEITIDQRTQPILFENIKVNNEPLSDEQIESTIHRVEKLDLAYNQNDISIDFSANNFIHSSQIKFQYAIDEHEWRDLGNQTTLLLSNLAPGQYKVGIRSMNHDGVFSEPRTVQLNISPPWWKTWWAYLLMAIILVMSVSFVFYFRVKRLDNLRKLLTSQVYERTKELEISKAQIEKSLEERETLLREIHHRVKNNLQIIANLLYLQSSKSEDENLKDILEEGQGRVRSMALIHQKLYENDDLKSIPFGEYVAELVNEIQASFGEQGAGVSVQINAKEIYFDVDNAVPLGLIINELTTNAFKYAYRDQKEGKFNIYITRSEGVYELKISDNGKGIPEEIDIRKTRSLGLRLVRVLSEQLEGEYRFENNGGMNFNLRFAA